MHIAQKNNKKKLRACAKNINLHYFASISVYK